MPKTQVVICPYCGETQSAADRCRSCGGLFEPLSRQATHNAMGPWYVRDPAKPFHPGCGYETLVQLIDRGQVSKYSIVRGPTTKQFWTVARHAPGVAHLLGYCHNCDASVDPDDHGCHVCGVSFGAYLDRNYLGLPDIRPLPWEAGLDEASHSPAGSRGVERAGLSRFATDEELLSKDAEARSGRIAPDMSTEPPGDESEDPDGTSVFDQYTLPAVTRVLRRQLASRQRAIRLLVVGLLLMGVVTIVTNLPAVSSWIVRPPATIPAETSVPVTDVPVDEDVATPPPATVEPDLPTEEVVAELPEDPLHAEYAGVLQLVVAAGHTDRSLDERIADYGKALERLQAIEGSATADNRPQGLYETMTQVQRELERLRLKRDFFGEADRT